MFLWFCCYSQRLVIIVSNLIPGWWNSVDGILCNHNAEHCPGAGWGGPSLWRHGQQVLRTFHCHSGCYEPTRRGWWVVSHIILSLLETCPFVKMSFKRPPLRDHCISVLTKTTQLEVLIWSWQSWHGNKMTFRLKFRDLKPLSLTDVLRNQLIMLIVLKVHVHSKTLEWTHYCWAVQGIGLLGMRSWVQALPYRI